MIGLLVGSLLLTPVSAGVTDNLNTALVSVLSKIADKLGMNNESTASIAANTGSLSNLSKLSSIDEKLDKISNSLEKLSISQSMASASSVKFENASWKSIHSVLQDSALEDYTWSVGDTKMMGNQKVVITKITYNAEGTPDEINIGMTKAVTKTGWLNLNAWCKDEAWKQVDTLTSIEGLGKAGHLPAYGEILESAGADKHITSNYGGRDDYPDTNGYQMYSDSTKHTLWVTQWGWNGQNHYASGSELRGDEKWMNFPVCPVITIH